MTDDAIKAAFARLLRGITQSETVGQYHLTAQGGFLYAEHPEEALAFSLMRETAEGPQGVKEFKRAAGEKFVGWLRERRKAGPQAEEEALQRVVEYLPEREV